MANRDVKRLELLQRWLIEHDLPSCFPEVSFLPTTSQFAPDSDIYLRQGGKELDLCVSRIFNSPRTLVHFRPGHGTSTLARAVHDKGQSDSRGLYLVLEPFKTHNSGISAEGIDLVLGNALAIAFLSRDFSNIKNAQSEAVLLNILGFADMTTFRHFSSRYRNAIDSNKGLPTNIEDWLASAATRFSVNIAEISRTLHAELNIATLLLFDFAHNTPESVILGTSRAMKWFEEHRKQAISNFPRMALIEVYFGSTEVLGIFQSNWDVLYDDIEITAYNAEEIFLILTKRFQPKNLGHVVPLQTIMHPDFAQIAYDSDMTLNEILKGMRGLLVESVDVPKAKLTAQLKPKAQAFNG